MTLPPILGTPFQSRLTTLGSLDWGVTPSAPRGAVTVDPAVLRVGPHGQEGRVAEAECAQAPNLPTGVSTLAGVRGPGCSGLSF